MIEVPGTAASGAFTNGFTDFAFFHIIWIGKI
jgi:hypothetical protein